MSDGPGEPPKDSLGLDLNSLKITDDKGATQPADEISSAPQEEGDATVKSDTMASTAEATSSAAQETQAPVPTSDLQEQATDTPDEKKPQSAAPPREKKKPYVNPERVKTGGAPRVRLSSPYSGPNAYS